LIYNLNGKRVEVDIEGKRLLGEFLHCIEESAVGYGEIAFSVDLVEGEHRAHHVFTIAGRDEQLLVSYFEQETVEDGERVLAVNYSRQCLKTTA
jgi:hypothetical protein